MKKSLPLVLALTVSFAGWFLTQAADEKKAEPLRLLLVLGGCCHDYATQQTLLKVGLESRLHATVEIEYNPDKSTGATFPLYEKDNWAEGYDLVIHDECSAAVTDPAYVKRILKAHRDGVPAVNLHCAMHSYRWGNFKDAVTPGADNSGWYEMIGIQSTGHGPQSPIAISYLSSEHPLTKGLANWTTVNEELYNNIQIFPGATPLAQGLQTQLPRPAKDQDPDPRGLDR